MSDAASVSSLARAGAARARSTELVRELRIAAMEGDEMRITHLLSELLRSKGLSRGQRIALQQRALLNLVHSLRSAALNDDLTGLYNRRSFLQIGTRLLDLAARDGKPAYLVYFGIDQLARINQALGRAAGDILIRQKRQTGHERTAPGGHAVRVVFAAGLRLKRRRRQGRRRGQG